MFSRWGFEGMSGRFCEAKHVKYLAKQTTQARFTSKFLTERNAPVLGVSQPRAGAFLLELISLSMFFKKRLEVYFQNFVTKNCYQKFFLTNKILQIYSQLFGLMTARAILKTDTDVRRVFQELAGLFCLSLQGIEVLVKPAYGFLRGSFILGVDVLVLTDGGW